MNLQLDRLFQHMAWADQAVLAALEQMTPLHQDATRLFSHLLAAEHIWLTRIQGQPTAVSSAWPTPSMDACRDLSARTLKDYAALVAATSQDQLQDLVTYRNLQGAEFQTPLGDILLHVALHGAYHRGQIAAHLRQAGIQPASTDFILFSRLGPDASPAS